MTSQRPPESTKQGFTGVQKPTSESILNGHSPENPADFLRHVLVDQSRDGIVIVKEDGSVHETNARFAAMIGHSVEEVLNLHVWDWDALASRRELLRMLHEVDHTGDSFETRHRRKDGSLYDVEITTNAAIFSGQKYIFCVCRDITERLRYTEELVLTRACVDKAALSIFWIDPDGRLIYVNETACTTLGYSKRELLTMGVWDLDPEHDQKMRPEQWRNLRSSSILSFLTRHRTRDGRLIPVQVTSNYIEHNGRELELAFAQDVSELELSRENLSSTVQRLAEAVESLRLAKDQAEAANRSKSEFLANMSHEIRTPINGILGMMQLMQTTRMTPDQQEFVELTIQSADRLTRLLTDILDLSRVEAGRMEIRSEEFGLDEIRDSVLGLFGFTARGKGLAIDCSMDPNIPPRLIGDEARVRQVLFNLVGNALKYTEQGRVELEMTLLSRKDDGQVRILFTVNDTGIGIPENRLKDIFEPFRQVDGSFTRKYQGAGLGLAIVHRLANLMGGHISIESEPEHGTSVYVTLPFQIVGPKGETPANEEPENVGPPGLRILLAEDEVSNSLPTRLLLEQAGHMVTLAENGQQALDLLAGQDFDLILMDIQMPIMDGVEATQAIRESKSLGAKKDIP
ncbi:MAG: PAS domain S-box protein, partial [Deltaproteobacteria bacterium]|nr:PAS domain S-box protein [Deltaproteobacteria bacterium]